MKNKQTKTETSSRGSSCNTGATLKSMRDLLSNEISKVQSRKLINTLLFGQAQQPISENLLQEPSSILDYQFLNPTAGTNYTKSTQKTKPQSKSQKKSNNPPLPQNSDLKKNNKAEDVYYREMKQKQFTEMKLEELRKDRVNKEMNEIRDKPVINPKSKKLSKNTPSLIKRLSQIESNYKEKIQKMKEEIMEEERLNNLPEFPKKETNRNFNEWLEKNEQWQYKREVKLNHLKEFVKKYECEEEDFRFIPEINQRSKSIVKSRGLSARFSRIGETKEEFVKRVEEETMPTFKPKINKSYKINDKYYDFMNQNQEQIYISRFKA